MKRLISLFVASALATVFYAQNTATKLVVNNSADGKSNITVYLPSKEKACGKAVLCCPGGGYSMLSNSHEGHMWANYFNEQGIAYAVLAYHMPNGDRNLPLNDTYNAMKTLRDSAAVWNINPRAIGIMGFSAGGHLASAVSTHAPFALRPNYTILFYPVISMDKKLTHRWSCENFLGKDQDNPSMIREWSSDKAVRSHLTPPAVIFTANDDRLVPPVTNAISYYTAMRNAGNECSMFIYPTGDHGFGFRPDYTYHAQLLSDLTCWLNNLSLPKVTDKKIACVGNSITDGHGIDMRTMYSYPRLLQRKLGAGYEVRNFGVSARTMLNKGDHPYQNEMAWKDCLAWQPDVVVVKLGTNDSKDPHQPYIATDYAKDMQQLIDSLRALPTNPRILLCTPIPAFKQTWTINDSVITNQIIPIIKETAQRNNCEVIDLHTLYGHDESTMQSDGIHPNAKGISVMLEHIYAAVTSEPKLPVQTSKKSKKSKKGKK